MDDIYRYRTNCIHVNEGSDRYIKEWITNDTTNIRIELATNQMVPHAFFTQINSTYYEWCGPFVLMAKTFARISKLRVYMTPQIDLAYYDKIYKKSGMAGLPQIALIPLIASLFLRFINKETEDLVYVAKHFTYAYPDRMLAKTSIAADHPFRQFQCFEIGVYFCIFASIFIISLVINFHKKSLNAFLTTFWAYLSVILSDYYSVPMSRFVESQLTGLWLISCTILLAAFSGQLRDQVMKGRPVYWMETKNDLFKWKQMTKIQTLIMTDFSNFIQHKKNTDPIAMELSQRDFQEYGPHIQMKIQDFIDLKGVKQGYNALVYPAHYIQIFKNMLVSDTFREDIDFHVGENGGYSTPLFTATNKANLNDTYSQLWDRVNEMIVESGLYEYLFKIALNPKRVGPDLGEKLNYHGYDFENINIEQISGMFLLTILLDIISIAIYLYEKYNSSFKIKFNKITLYYQLNYKYHNNYVLGKPKRNKW